MKKNNKAILNSFKNSLISGRGIKHYKVLTRLNDMVINAYFQLIEDRSKLKTFFVDSLNFDTFKKNKKLKVHCSLKHSHNQVFLKDYIYFFCHQL